MTDIASTPSADQDAIRRRKGRHLSVCIEPNAPIESAHTFFEEVRLVHHALPEVDVQEINTTTEFLGHQLKYPFFVSCMTGGSEAGARVNRHLVQAAQVMGIPVGLGSMRVLLREPELWHHFHMKPLAPDVPVWANLSAAQLRELNLTDLVTCLQRLEVQALVLHCNAGQEQFQLRGDRCFAGVLEDIQRICECSPIPVLVKETGFGLRVEEVHRLVQCGVAAVDVAGAGGTNWVLVESQCQPSVNPEVARSFANWGNPTPLILAALFQSPLPVLASGGIRSGVDIAKSLALGAELAGLALPFVQVDHQDGLEGVLAYMDTLIQSLRTAMLLTGSRTIADLRQTGVVLSDSFLCLARQYRAGGDWRSLLV